MHNKAPQIKIEDEILAVRVLSLVFIAFMLMIIGSYADTPRDNVRLVQNITAAPEQHIAANTKKQLVQASATLITHE